MTKCNNCDHRSRESITGSRRLKSWYRAGRPSLWTRQTGVCVSLNKGLKEPMLFLPVRHISVSVSECMCVCVLSVGTKLKGFRSCRNRWDSTQIQTIQNTNPDKKKHVNARTFVMYEELLLHSRLYFRENIKWRLYGKENCLRKLYLL